MRSHSAVLRLQQLEMTLQRVRNMTYLFDSIPPSRILLPLYVRAIGLFSRCDLTFYLGFCTHLTITFFSSGLCSDSQGSLHLLWHCMTLLVLMCR